MPHFKLLQLDQGAQHILPLAKKFALREYEALKASTGMPAFRRTWLIEGATVTAHAAEDVIRLWVSMAQGVTDYVGMYINNPVPGRGVNIGVAYPYGPPQTPTITFGTGVPVSGPGWSGFNYPFTITDVFGNVAVTGTAYYGGDQGGGPGYQWINYPSATGTGGTFGYNEHTSAAGYMGDRLAGETAHWYYINGTSLQDGAHPGYAWTNRYTLTGVVPSYETMLAADPLSTLVKMSDGTLLTSEPQTTSGGHTYYVPNTTWNGEGYVNMYVDSVGGTPNHQLTFTVPEDCVAPVPAVYSAVFDARRRAWLKKNSDEFIAALKTGFAAGAAGVTRPELQMGLPPSWDYNIKGGVQLNYGIYPHDQYGVRVGRHSQKAAWYAELSATDTVVSDTSGNLAHAGVKVTQRVVGLAYVVLNGPYLATTVTGTLTQTVTAHMLSGSQVALSRKDVYANWYMRDQIGESAPTGAPALVYPYVDRYGMQLGCVLNGTLQQGYNADSTLGTPSNTITYLGYSPAYPKASSTLAASLISGFTSTWHKDSKPIYQKTRAGTAIEDDTPLYGVTEIDISPVGVIANGLGTAPAGTSLGMFSTGEDGLQVEIYGTASYKYDYQSGALTFKAWKPLHDSSGNVVASKLVTLPPGFPWSSSGINCIITYKGIPWSDVVHAIKKYGPSTISDIAGDAIRQAIKAG